MSILWDNGAWEGFFRVFHFHKTCLSGRIKDTVAGRITPKSQAEWL